MKRLTAGMYTANCEGGSVMVWGVFPVKELQRWKEG